MDLYIYYRVPCEHALALQERVAALQLSMSREYGIVAGLKRRPEEKDDRQTWMEIYQAVPEGFDTVLEGAVARAGLSELIDGRRNTEYFVDVSTCA